MTKRNNSIRVTERVLIVMGVSGCGKSTIGHALAQRLACPFLEGDDAHPATNRAKMRQGVALTDEDRWPWLMALAAEINRQTEPQVIASCSALKKSYRDHLRQEIHKEVRFIWLDVPRASLAERLATRTGHFMPASLLDSQLATLEPPQGHDALRVAEPNIEQSLRKVLSWIERAM